MSEAKKTLIDNIFRQIDKVKYNEVAPLLLKARALLQADRRSDGETKEIEVQKRYGKRLIWQSDLISLLAAALSRDFLKVEDDWMCASALCSFVRESCVASEGFTGEAFRQTTLSIISKNSWILLKNVRKYSNYKINETYEARIRLAFEQICENVYSFYVEFSYLLADAWQSPELLSMMQDEGRPLDLLLLQLCTKLARLLSQAGMSAAADAAFFITDAILERWTGTISPQMVEACATCLLTFMRSNSAIIDRIRRTRSDRIISLIEKWSNYNLEADFKAISNCLLTSSTAQNKRIQEATTTIQAFYRGYRARQRYKKLRNGFIKLQRLIRKSQNQRRLLKAKPETKAEKMQRIALEKHRNDRQFLEKHFQTLSCIHPSLTEKYLESISESAATTIQAGWRGYATRRRVKQLRQFQRTDKAARIIQNSMRQWYRKRTEAKSKFHGLPEVTEARREQLQRMIDTYQERRQTRSVLTKDEQRHLHDQCQSLLVDHFERCQNGLRSSQRRDALLARLEIDAQLLENAPSLKEAKESDVILFGSKANAICYRAAHFHKMQIKFHRLPEWRQMYERCESKFS